MSQRHNDNIKIPKPKENQLGILKIYAFCWNIQQSASGSGESTVGVVYLSMRIHLKSCHFFSVEIATTLFSDSMKGTVGVSQSHSYVQCQGYMLTLQALTHIEQNNQNGRPIWIYATITLTCGNGAKPDRVTIQLNSGEVLTHAS